jgi:hypothetical protein
MPEFVKDGVPRKTAKHRWFYNYPKIFSKIENPFNHYGLCVSYDIPPWMPTIIEIPAATPSSKATRVAFSAVITRLTRH